MYSPEDPCILHEPLSSVVFPRSFLPVHSLHKISTTRGILACNSPQDPRVLCEGSLPLLSKWNSHLLFPGLFHTAQENLELRLKLVLMFLFSARNILILNPASQPRPNIPGIHIIKKYFPHRIPTLSWYSFNTVRKVQDISLTIISLAQSITNRR
jgi:hypothetical protein